MWEKLVNSLFILQKKTVLSNLKKMSGVQIASDFKLGNFSSFSIDSKLKNFIIKEEVVIRNSFNCVVGENANLMIEKGVFMNNQCSVNALESVSIGENTLFGENVKIYDHNHKITESPEFNIEKREFISAPVKIGKNCWLGSNVVVLKGVTIGDNSISGAGCVIHKDIPANSKIVKVQTFKNLNE